MPKRAPLLHAVVRGLTGLLGLALLVGCGGDELPRPEGFILNITFVSIDPNVITDLDVNVEPQGMDEAFAALVMPIAFDENGVVSEDGPIRYDVADDGVLELDIRGDYVASHSMDNGNGTYTFPLQMWSAILDCNENGQDCDITQETRSRSPAPTARVIANRTGVVLGDALTNLPQWPLPVGSSGSVEVSCRATSVDRCTN